MSKSEIRPHHGLCANFFEGKGYHPLFVRHMSEVLHDLETQNPEIRLVIRKDEICQACPHHHDQICESECKVRNYDQHVLKLCGLQENDCLSWKEFQNIVKMKILKQNKLSEICHDCQWFYICEKKKLS